MTEKDYAKISVIIPTLNEAQTINELLSKLKELYPEIKIIVADDVSQDGTQQIVRDFAAKYQADDVVLLERKDKVHGLTASVLDGIGLVKTDYFIVMDGDMQHPPQVVAEMAEKAINGCDVVAGARIPYKENQGIHRVIMTRIATKIAKTVLRLKGLKISDPMSGFFCAKTALVQGALKEHGNSFEPRGYKVFFELLKILPKPLVFDEVFYQFAFRTGGKSKLRPKHLFYFINSLLK